MFRLPFDEVPEIFQMTSEEERALYQQHFEMLQDWNIRMALVSRKSIGHAFENHYVDSVMTAEFGHRFYKEGPVYDLGSGAGFPGVVFAIRYRHIKVVLFERVQKKQKFLNAVIQSLALQNAEVQGEWNQQNVTGLIFARAVTPRTELFKFLESRVSPGSILVANSGGEADISQTPPSFKLVASDKYPLPKDAGFRQIEAQERVPRTTC